MKVDAVMTELHSHATLLAHSAAWDGDMATCHLLNTTTDYHCCPIHSAGKLSWPLRLWMAAGPSCCPRRATHHGRGPLRTPVSHLCCRRALRHQRRLP